MVKRMKKMFSSSSPPLSSSYYYKQDHHHHYRHFNQSTREKEPHQREHYEAWNDGGRKTFSNCPDCWCFRHSQDSNTLICQPATSKFSFFPEALFLRRRLRKTSSENRKQRKWGNYVQKNTAASRRTSGPMEGNCRMMLKCKMRENISNE